MSHGARYFYGYRPEDAICTLTDILREVDGEVLFATCVHQDGQVGDSECFVSRDRSIHEFPAEAAVSLPLKFGARQVLISSRTAAPATDDDHLAFTRRLIEAGKVAGVEIYDHVIIGHDSVTRMRQESNLWN